MSNSTIDIKAIRNKFIQVIIIQFSPGLLFNFLTTSIESLPEEIRTLIALILLSTLLYGYGLCCVVADKYAKYKGYKNHFYIYSILNIFGLSLLFLLKNRNSSENTNTDKEPLLNFSILSVLISFCAVSIALMPLQFLMALCIAGKEGVEEYFLNNEDFSSISTIPILMIFVWYVIKEFKRANINYRFILGSLKEVDFKLVVVLTTMKFFFAWGMYFTTLYGLSFIFPNYVENQINDQSFTTVVGCVSYQVGALFFAPLMEELIYRGIVLQKFALKKDIFQGLIISAIAFTLMHFRFDVIPLFITGIIYALLYLKTKQLAMPILCHFLYNLIVGVTNIYDQYFSGVDPSIKTTVAEYQQQFLDKWQLNILFIALSAPYLAYFIYKNFPRNYDIQRLPYFANQLSSSN
jgi:uncharacterized protein